MRVRIQGPATVTREGQPIIDARRIRALNGAESAADCAEYIDSDLVAAAGIEGGKVRLSYDSASKRFIVVTEYIAERKLTSAELRRLIAATRSQWSDGIGEACFDELAERLDVEIDFTFAKGKVVGEQIVDAASAQKTGRKPGKHALPQAAFAGDVETVRTLLDAGADIEAEWQNMKPLQLAVLGSHVAIAQLLIERGANVKARDKETGWDPLIWCGQGNQVKDRDAAAMATALLEAGVPPNGQRGKTKSLRRTPLEAAQEKPKLMAVLRQYGATE